MPALKKRKIIKLGGSRVIALPADWLAWIREKYGVDLREVIVEVDDDLIVKPKIS